MITTILHLSDTHNLHKQLVELPKADVIVHSGDFTFAGSIEEALDFYDWFSHLPYRYKLYVAGNHDECMYKLAAEEDNGCYYLCNSAVELEGVKFYGIPKFMKDSIIGSYSRQINQIPPDTDILISHDAPFGIMDYSEGVYYGNPELLSKVNTVKPHLHLFGHIHASYGVHRGACGTIFSNAALIEDSYQNLINKPIIHTL